MCSYRICVINDSAWEGFNNHGSVYLLKPGIHFYNAAKLRDGTTCINI